MKTKVLVIDDDIAITELTSALLQVNGFEVITTNNSAEGVKFAAEKNPNIVVLDLMMPEMDGWQISKEIRKFSNIPILVLSAVSDPNKVASILDAGADGFLSKPVAASVLIAHIKQMTKQIGSLGNIIPKAGSDGVQRNIQPLLS